MTFSGKICVIGAGHGGTSMAAHLGLMGFEVNLWNRTPEHLEPIRQRGGIELLTPEGYDLPKGTATLNRVTSNMAEALEDVELVMVVVPATAHKDIARACAEHLHDGQVVVLNPGRTGGALEFRQVLNSYDCKAKIILAETQTFIYASRVVGPAQSRIFSVKNSIPVAALPAYETPTVLKILRQVYPQFVPGDNVLKTGLENVAILFHPTVMILNAGRIEDQPQGFEYYLEGITPSVALLLEALDEERIRVAEALGLRAMRVREWLYIAYDSVGRNLYEAVRSNSAYKDLMAPPSLHHRYILEDVPTSLVPMISLGEQFGVETPLMRSLVEITSRLVQQDFWSEGRTTADMGIAGLNVKQVRRYVTEGIAGDP
ncbi:MAG: NAD/NADP octopine/nopaline dehydrogenase family protein [Candidatus Zipacnadales bacterium]